MDHRRQLRQKAQNNHGSLDGFVRRTPGRSAGSGFDFQRRSMTKREGDLRDKSGQGERFFASDTSQARPQSTMDEQLVHPRFKSYRPEHSTPRHHKKRGMLKLASKTFVGLLIVSIVMGGYLFGKGYLKARQIFKGGGGAIALQENADPTKLNGEGDGRVNIMLLGTGGEGHDNGTFLMDTIIIASIDPIQKEAALLSIPRDFYVKTDYGSMRINALYKIARNDFLSDNPKDKAGSEEAGFRAMEEAVEKAMGIPVHYYAMIDFEGFKKAIDTVGGITINVDQAVYERLSIDGRTYVLDVKTGQERFDGFRALAYARSRKTSPRGDFDRSERQREMLIALKDKILTIETLANPLKLNQLFSDFGDHMRTNLSVNELLRLNQIGKTITADKVESVSLVDPPNVLLAGSNVGGSSVQIPKAGLNNYKDIHNFIRNKLRDGYLRNEQANIAVLNGTNVTGLASRTSDELKSFGYYITQVADSPIKNQQQTILVDLRGGQKKYTRAYLEKRFGVTAVASLPDARIQPGDADFVIILGQNEQNRLQN
jgi:LCP family protein required for cell wall assembly